MSPLANIRVQFQLLMEGQISPAEVLERISPADVAALLLPTPENERQLRFLGSGMPAGTGAASGRICFQADPAKLRKTRDPLIWVIPELERRQFQTSSGFAGILTTDGGIASHAALVCRQRCQPCVAGFPGIWDIESGALRVKGRTALREGDWLTIDGLTGQVFSGRSNLVAKPWQEIPELQMVSLVVDKAVATGHVPAACAGSVWRIWDFLRHNLPLTRRFLQRSPARKAGSVRISSRENQVVNQARQQLKKVKDGVGKNHSEIILGLIRTLDRLLGATAKGRSAFRLLWNPTNHLHLDEWSQFVGFEYAGVNRRIPHLAEVSVIQFLLECEVPSSAEAWSVQTCPRLGRRIQPGAMFIKASRLMVNGAELNQADVAAFYTWLRRREYY